MRLRVYAQAALALGGITQPLVCAGGNDLLKAVSRLRMYLDLCHSSLHIDQPDTADCERDCLQFWRRTVAMHGSSGSVHRYKAELSEAQLQLNLAEAGVA